MAKSGCDTRYSGEPEASKSCVSDYSRYSKNLRSAMKKGDYEAYAKEVKGYVGKDFKNSKERLAEYDEMSGSGRKRVGKKKSAHGVAVTRKAATKKTARKRVN